MNDLLGYVLESFFDSRQEKLNLLSTPETLKSKDVVEYIRSNMKGSKAKPGAFLREGALYFLNSMVKEGGALDRGKPGTSAPGYAFVGGKREYGRVSGDDPLRKVQRPLVVPDVDYPGVSKEKLVDVIIHEGLAMFRRWSNRNKPRFFAYNSVAPRTNSETEDDTEELLDLYGMHHKRFARLHELVIEHNDASPIAFSPEKGKLPIGVGGFQTGISINRAPQARWLCLKLRIKEGATWTMYSSSVGKLGVKLSRAGLQPMVSTYGRLWDIWIVLPDELTMPGAYDLIGNMDGIKRIGQASKGAPFRSFLMDSVIISNKTFADDTCIFPLSLHIHHGKEKVATNQKGMGNQDFSIDTGLSMIPTSGMLTLFDQGIENHPLQAMFNAPDLLARVYRFARSAEIIPELNTEGPLLEIDSSLSNIGREAWVAMKEHKDESFMGELRVAPEGRDVTLVYDGAKAYITGLPDDRKLTNIPQTEEFAQLCKGPTVVYGKIQGDDAESLVAMLSMMDVKDYDEKKIYQSFYKRTILIWSAEQSVDLRLNALSGQFVRSVKRAAPDDLDEMMNVSPYGLIVRDPYGMGEDGTDELMPANQNTPVLVLGYEKDSVQNNEARVLIVGKVVSAQVDVLGRGKRQPVVKQGTQTRDEYQEVARVGTFSGFTYEDRRDIYSYLSGLDYQSEHEGDILIDPIEAGMILEMEYRGLLKDKPMWRYNRKGSHRDWQEKQKLPGMGEREVTGVKSTYSLDPMNKEPMPQYNNPKIVGYRVEMGREEQRITPFLIASSDVAFGVGVKSNPPIELSKYTNYVQKENSPFLSVLGFKSENAAKEDQSMFEGKMKERFGEEITIIHNGNTLTAVKKGTKIGEVCENCGGPKIFSPPGFTKQERAADEGPSVYFSCSICGRETRQRDRRNPPGKPITIYVGKDTPEKLIQETIESINAFAKFFNTKFDIRTKVVPDDNFIRTGTMTHTEMMKNPYKIHREVQHKNIYDTLCVFWFKKNIGGLGGFTNPGNAAVLTEAKLSSRPYQATEGLSRYVIFHEIGHLFYGSMRWVGNYFIDTHSEDNLGVGNHCTDQTCGLSAHHYTQPKESLQNAKGAKSVQDMFCQLCIDDFNHNWDNHPGLFGRAKNNPLVSVEAQPDKANLKFAQKILRYDADGKLSDYKLSEETAPYLHTEWPEWFRRNQRDLLVRGLERLDYEGVVKGIANRTGSPYYQSLLGIAKRNSGKGLIKNRKQHQELAMLYTLCHNDVDFILTWPNATSSDMLDKFESELESSSTIIYQKEIPLTKKAASMLCMQMYAGEDFVSKKQCVRKALASGWLEEDDDDEERKIRIYLIHSGSEKTLRGQAAPRKEELRSIFKTSKDDKKSYIHTADNPVQVTEYAQVLLNENSLLLLQHNNIDLILPRNPNREWVMINSVKKYMQQEFGSLFFICTSMKSGLGAYLHGIRTTNDVDMMIDDRRLGPDAKEKIERMSELFPFLDAKLAYSERNSKSFWNYETFVPGKTWYDKRNEMTHNPKYHAYFLGLKVETPEGFLYQRMARVSNDSRPRATSDLLMLLILIDEGRFRFLDKKIRVPWKRSMVESYNTIPRWLKIAKFWMKARYRRDMSRDEIWGLLGVAIKHNRPKRNRDLDATEEHLLSGIEGRYNDLSETRNNPSQPRIIVTVPHALPAGEDYEEHWCDWSANPAAHQLQTTLEKKYDTQLHISDKQRTEIDYNRILSAETPWQHELDDLLKDAKMLVDVHSFPVDDPMWAGYDFVLFSSDKWPLKAQEDQSALMEHLRECGYKVMMDIADHRNYIQEKGVKLGIPSFLIEFGEHLKLKKPCEDLAKCLDTFFVKSNGVIPKKRGGMFPTAALQVEMPGERDKHESNETQRKKHDALVQKHMRSDYNSAWGWNRPVAESKQAAEQKALKKARKKADKEIGAFTVCPTECLFCYNEQHGAKTNPPVAPGMTRLWRGGKDNKYPLVPKGEEPKEWSPYAQWKFGGRYFTTDKDHAMSYAKRTDGIGGKGPAQLGEKVLMYIDIKTKDLPKYHLPYIKEKMIRQHQSLGSPSVLEYKSKFHYGKINLNELEYPIIGSGSSDAESDKLREIEYWIGPNIELYGKVKVHSRWTDNPPNTHVVISRSDKADKKLKAVFHKPNGRTTTTHFGGKHYSDYTIHKDRKRMERYNNRHRTNENWNKFMSAGALSKWILWNKPSLKGSFDDYLDMFGITGELKVKTSQAGEIKHGKKNPPADGITWKTRRFKFPVPKKWRTKMSGSVVGNVFQLEGTDEEGNTVEMKTNKYDTETEYDFSNSAIASQDWLRQLGIHSYAYVVGIDASKKGIGLGQAAYLKMAEIAPAVLSTNHSESAERAWGALEKHAPKHGYTIHKRKITYPMSKAKGDEFDGEGFRYDRVLVKNEARENPVVGLGLPMLIGKIIKGFDALETELATDHFRILENPPIFPRPERVSGKKGGKYLMDSGKDVTGLHFKKAEIIGSDKSINVEWENQVKKPEPKPAPKSGMRRIRFNMLRPSKFDGYDESWIVASETSKGHIYSLKVKVHTTLTLQTFPNKKSEPRLRPETYGSIIAFNQIGEITIKSSGKKHPLFAAVYVSKTKRNVNNAVPLLVRKHTRTIPPFEEFTSTSLEERMKNAGYKRMAARTIGRILPGMVKEGLLVQTSYSGQAVYRNSERAYNEYLAEQEEARNNPRTPEGRKVPKRYLKGLNKTEKAIAKYEVDRGYKYDIDDPEAYEDWKSDIMAKARGMETAPSRFKLKFIKKYGPLPKGKDLVSRLAKATGIKKQYIQKAYDKGLAAWRGGHRPGTVQHQWASGRAYALVMGAPTSTGKGKPDFQLAVKAGVRDKNGKLLI